MGPTSSIRAISDLHVTYAENRALVDHVRPQAPGDWLIVAGDVGETIADVEWTLSELTKRFERVLWAPGNHELWTLERDTVQLRGVERYEHLVERCGDLGVLTPEDAYPLWTGAGGPVRIAPMFLLYDYSWHAPGTSSTEASLARAFEVGIVCTDEFLLHPDPFESRAAWC